MNTFVFSTTNFFLIVDRIFSHLHVMMGLFVFGLFAKDCAEVAQVRIGSLRRSFHTSFLHDEIDDLEKVHFEISISYDDDGIADICVERQLIKISLVKSLSRIHKIILHVNVFVFNLFVARKLLLCVSLNINLINIIPWI